MSTIHISLLEADARAKLHNVDSIGTASGAQLLALAAYDIATDIYPENDTRLIGTTEQSVKGENFEFEIS